VKILDSLMVSVCVGVSLVVELVYLTLAHLMLRPTADEVKARVDLAQAQFDKAQIKSVQLQLVESSKLERRINTNEKKLEKFAEARVPHVALVAKLLTLLKALAYVVVCLEYMYPTAVIFKYKSDLLWPYRASGSVYFIPAWQVLAMTALASRYALRALQPAVFPNASVP